MRILNWVQSKINGRVEKKKPDAGYAAAPRYHAPDTRKEEFSDWPHGLLAIGTFGNTDLKNESERHDHSENSFSSQDLPDFTVEEVDKLQKELTKLLSLKPKPGSNESERGSVGKNLPLDKFLNCPSSLEIDRKACQKICNDLENVEAGELSPNSKIILKRARDALAENRNALKQKSFSFLLKKMFVCKGGFMPTPTIREPLPDSRMEKILKAILHKKIYPHNSAQIPTRKYLEKKPMDEKEDEEKMQQIEDSGCKWVKTDSEYIVLEI